MTQSARILTEKEIQKLFAGKQRASGATEDNVEDPHMSCAVYKCDTVDYLKLLIQNNYPLNITKDGRTPLILATILDKVDHAKCLIDAGAKLDLKDSSGKSALHYALIRPNLEIARYLIEKGADIHVRDSQNHLPLYHAYIWDQTKGDDFFTELDNPNESAQVTQELYLQVLGDCT